MKYLKLFENVEQLPTVELVKSEIIKFAKTSKKEYNKIFRTDLIDGSTSSTIGTLQQEVAILTFMNSLPSSFSKARQLERILLYLVKNRKMFEQPEFFFRLSESNDIKYSFMEKAYTYMQEVIKNHSNNLIDIYAQAFAELIVEKINEGFDINIYLNWINYIPNQVKNREELNWINRGNKSGLMNMNTKDI